MKNNPLILLLWFSAWFASSVCTHAQTPGPLLQVEQISPGQFRVAWIGSGTFTLEEAASLETPIPWQPVTQTPAPLGGRFSVIIQASARSRFFRLRSGGALTRIEQTSPAHGESGVAVTRETIFRFNQPLVLTTVLNSDRLYAEARGRRVLSRVELASDRRSVTLFYLEDLPGSARVRVTLDGTGIFDERGVALDADGDGQPGGVATLEFDTLSFAVVPGTAVMGRVFASDLVPGPDTATNAVNRPLAGVTITVDGAEQTLRAVTDELGNFRLEPSPAGRFFVHVDGRTARGGQWPTGAYYPFVGKAWEAVPGVATSLAGGTGEIYLPLVAAGTLQPVSLTETTIISFPPSVISSNPALTGVSMAVPPNALLNEQGVRGGRIGIAPVPPNRLPEPLPPGLQFPLVITVQSDGPLNFDQPVPLRFPNLPDPATGQRLAAGAKTALWAFNHDTGRWEVQGPMTVSADAQFIECDPGVGVRQPGWVGTNPGTPTGPPPFGPPPLPPLECPTDPGASLAGAVGLAQSGGESCAFQRYRCLMSCTWDSAGCFALEHACSTACGYVFDKACAVLEDLPGGDQLCGFIEDEVCGEVCGEMEACWNEVQQCKDFCHAQFTNCEKCQMGPSPGLAKLHNHSALHANEPELDAALAYVLEVQTMLDAYVDLRRRVRQILGSLRPTDDLTPAQIAQLRPLGEEADRLFGGLTGAEYFRNAFARVQGEASQISAGHQVFGKETGFYAMENVASGLVSRGRTDIGGAVQNVILAPESHYRLHVYLPAANVLARAQFVSASSGFPSQIPGIAARFEHGPDQDQDGLGAAVEFVLGTASDKADTDGDGISDDAEVRQGTDPNSGLAVATGIVAAVDTPGQPVDVSAANDIVAVADGSAGVALFNVFAGLTPSLVAQLTTSQPTTAVAHDGNFLTAAIGNGGVAIWDLTAPGTPALRHQVSLGGNASEAAVSAGLVFAAVAKEVVVVDAVSGTVLDRRVYGGTAAESVHDLSVAGDYLYVLSASPSTGGSHTIHKVPLTPLLLPAVAALTISGAEHPTFGRMHLFAGGGLIYVGAADDNAKAQVPGLEILEDTATGLVLVGRPSPITAFDVEVNGSGLALFTGADPGLTVSAKVGVLDVRDRTDTDRFLSGYDTPGAAKALALYNGLCYVAESVAGLQVINYLAHDRQKQPPTIGLASNAANGAIVAGDRLRITADTSDDVQVRNVEFYLDDVRFVTDGNFPFEMAMQVPLPRANRNSLRFRARASDTGGNAAWSEELTVQIASADRTQGNLTLLPSAGATTTSLRAVGVLLDAIPGLASLGPNEVILTWAGPDARLDTADDETVTGGSLNYVAAARAVLRSFPDDLRNGLYRAQFPGTLRDTTGVNFPAATWEFRSLSGSAIRVSSSFPRDDFGNALDELSVTFSEPVAADALIPENFSLVAPGPDGTLGTADDAPVTGATLTLDLNQSMVRWKLARPLPFGSYRATVRRRVTDQAGNPLTGDYAWDFQLRDLTAPAVLATAPAFGTEFRSGPSAVEVYFDEAIAESTLTSESFALFGFGPDNQLFTSDDAKVPGTLEYTPSIYRATLRFAAPLAPAEYRVALSSAITDLAGRSLSLPAPTRFTVLIRTQVRGRVLTPESEPAAGAEVRLSTVSPALVVGADGVFQSGDLWLPPWVQLSTRAQLTRGASQFTGAARLLRPVHDGITDVGTIQLQETCPPYLDTISAQVVPPNGEVNAMAVLDDGQGPALYAVTGAFYGARRARVLRWNGAGWDQIGQDFTFSTGGATHLRALAAFNDGTGLRIYVGGEFDRNGDVVVRNIARWNGASWEPVGDGLTGFGLRPAVNALLVFDPGTGPVLLAGGEFNTALGAPRHAVMQWNGTSWTPLGDGISNTTFKPVTVLDLAVWNEPDGPTLYAGGSILEVGGEPASHLARWRNGTWSAVPGGVRSGVGALGAQVRALAVFDDGSGPALFVGGHFQEAGGVAVNSIARWNGATWSAAGQGFWYASRGQLGTVHELLPWNRGGETWLLASGFFDQIDGVRGFANGPGLLRWNGSAWQPLQGTLPNEIGVNGLASALAVFDDGAGSRLYVGGTFTDVYADRRIEDIDFAARYSDAGWEPAGHPLNRPVDALAWATVGTDTSLYGGGTFTFGGSSRLQSVFRWDGRSYRPLGSGLRHIAPASITYVNVLTGSFVGGGPSLYAGGQFELAGEVVAANLARWDGSSWSSVGDVTSSSGGGGAVYAIAEFADADARSLIVAGDFANAGGVSARNVARWDGSRWSALGEGLSPFVLALAVMEEAGAPTLYAAGNLNIPGPDSKRYRNVARWDNGKWLPVFGGGTEPPAGVVRELYVHDDANGPALYAGGEFERATDGRVLNSVAKWDGRRWTYLNSVLGDFTFTHVADFRRLSGSTGAALYAAVTRMRAGEIPIVDHVVARWDGNAWEAFETNEEMVLRALAVNPADTTPTLYLGGGMNPFNGAVWRWSQPTPPCP